MAKCFLAYDFGYELDLDGLELRDIAVAVQDKIDRLHDRRERYHDWLRFDAPADYVPDGTMWSQYDEDRLQRLENLMAEIAERGAVTSEDFMADHTAEVAAEDAFTESVAGRSYVMASEIWHHLDTLEEFGVVGVAILQKNVLDTAVSLLKHFRTDKNSQIEQARKMAALMPRHLKGEMDKQFSEAEWLVTSVDDVLPFLENCFCVNLDPDA